jgi:hypothetical protein
VFVLTKLNKLIYIGLLSTLMFAFIPSNSLAGGGLVLKDDICILWIDFYSSHFTAYQPASSGNTQFCRDLPDTGETILVLDYLHQSLKLVPVSFRIIRNVTGQGSFVKLKHVEALGDLEQHTVFYQPPVVREDASLTLEFDLKDRGEYIGIMSAGHPSNDTLYTAVFAFEVGAPKYDFLYYLVPLLAAGVYFYRRKKAVAAGTTTPVRQAAG